MSEVWGLPCKERWRGRSKGAWTIEFKPLQRGERLAHCRQHVRFRFPCFIGQVEGDRTDTIGMCETGDQAMLYFDMPVSGARLMINDDRQRWESSYRNRSSRSEDRDKEPYV